MPSAGYQGYVPRNGRCALGVGGASGVWNLPDSTDWDRSRDGVKGTGAGTKLHEGADPADSVWLALGVCTGDVATSCISTATGA